MTDFFDTTGYDMNIDQFLSKINDELEQLYAAQETAKDAVEKEAARSATARLQTIQRTLLRVKNMRPNMAPLLAIDDLIAIHQSRSDQQSTESFLAAKEYILGQPTTIKVPQGADTRPRNEAENSQQTIERLKQRIHLEGLMFVNSSLPSEQWEEGRKNSAVFAEETAYNGSDVAYCPGQSSLRDPAFLRQHMTMLFNGKAWGAPEPREFSDYDLQKERDALTYRIAPIRKNVLETVEEKIIVAKKPLFGFIPRGTEERSETRNIYKGTTIQHMNEFVATKSEKLAFHVSLRRTAWTKWEDYTGSGLGRPGEESITLIVPEDIARELATLIQTSPEYALSLYDALRPSWMGDERTIIFRPTSFIRGEVDDATKNV